ncbi:MAG: RNA polymerase sigma factor, partial [Nitrososphaerales archaeon]
FLAALERERDVAGMLADEQRAWLWTVARNKANDYHRRHRRQHNVPLEHVEEMIDEASTPEQVKPVEQTKPIEYDPFDLKTIRKNQSFLIGAAEKLISSYVVRKPKKNAFFRVHSGEDYQVSAYIYVAKDEGGMEKETYFLDSAFSLQIEEADLSTLFYYVTLHLAIERHAEKPFLWALRQPILGGRDNEFWRTAREAAEKAKTDWLRISASEGAYDIYLPRVMPPEPIWPKTPFEQILRIAFKNHVIDGPEHPVMKEYWGEA